MSPNRSPLGWAWTDRRVSFWFDRGNWSFARFWALTTLVLVCVTYPIWLPGGCFPSIPLVSLGSSLVDAFSVISVATIVAVLFWIVGDPNGRSWRWGIVAGGLALAFTSDQHRLQPWAYQAFLYAVIFSLRSTYSESTGRLDGPVMMIAVSIYLYSALGKFDYQFAHTVGQDFLSTLLGWTGITRSPTFLRWREILALGFPAAELTLGLGLLLAATRRVCGYGVMLMHGTLLVILGPLGLQHSVGVLVWNVALGVQAWMLFVRRRPGAISPPQRTAGQLPAADISKGRTGDVRAIAGRRGASRPVAGIALACFVLFALLAPLGERYGYWDHWLSWGLYAPHNSRVLCEVPESVVPDLPEDLRRQVLADHDQDGWCRIDFAAWSLACTGAPIYPQARYQRELAARVAIDLRLASRVRAIEYGVSDRWTGVRESRLLFGTGDLVGRDSSW